MIVLRVYTVRTLRDDVLFLRLLDMFPLYIFLKDLEFVRRFLVMIDFSFRRIQRQCLQFFLIEVRLCFVASAHFLKAFVEGVSGPLVQWPHATLPRQIAQLRRQCPMLVHE